MESETTPDEKERIRFLIQKLIANDKDWFRKQDIIATDKGNYWIMNYLGKPNDYNRLVRGMVVQKPPMGWHGDAFELIKSFPFTRFFNVHEPWAEPVNLANSEMLEKLDGCMVGVYFPTRDPKNPQWHTRKMMSTHARDMDMNITSFAGKNYKFLALIGSYVKKLHYQESDVENTYIFEFLHEASHVVTKYKESQYGLYLIGGRHIPSHKEFSEKDLDVIAVHLGVPRPRRWDSAMHHEEIVKMMKEIGAETEDFEGFVFRDKVTGKRVKLKDQDYVIKHKKIDATRSIDALVKAFAEEDEDELIAYKPELKKVFAEMRTTYNKYVEATSNRIWYWLTQGLSKRDLSVKMFGEEPLSNWEKKMKQIRGEKIEKIKGGENNRTVTSLALSFYGKVNSLEDVRYAVDRHMKEIALGKNKNEGNPKKFIELLGLNKVNTGEDVGEI